MANEKTSRAEGAPAAGRVALHRDKAKFRKADISRAIKGALAAGLDFARVEIDSEGKIAIILGSCAQVPPAAVDARGGVIVKRLRERNG